MTVASLTILASDTPTHLSSLCSLGPMGRGERPLQPYSILQPALGDCYRIRIVAELVKIPVAAVLAGAPSGSENRLVVRYKTRPTCPYDHHQAFPLKLSSYTLSNQYLESSDYLHQST